MPLHGLCKTTSESDDSKSSKYFHFPSKLTLSSVTPQATTSFLKQIPVQLFLLRLLCNLTSHPTISIGISQRFILDPLLYYLSTYSSRRPHPCSKCPLYKYTNNSQISIPSQRVCIATESIEYSHWSLGKHLEP